MGVPQTLSRATPKTNQPSQSRGVSIISLDCC
nr:MAG TPA: hypothetical protein [Caudoviricetes sp.]